MSAVMIERPGVGLGPCLKCEHEDCAENRQLAASRCDICKKPLGYDTKFFMDPVDDKPNFRKTHMLCRVKEIESNKAKA